MIRIVMLIVLLFNGCNSNKEDSNYCLCPIPENIDIKTKKENLRKERKLGAEVDVEAMIKRIVGTKISMSGSYSNSESKIEEVFKEIKGSNPLVTQNANIYRSIACAYYEIACKDKSLNDDEKRERLNEIINGYELNVDKVFNAYNPKAKTDDTQIKPIPPKVKEKIAFDERVSVKPSTKTESQKLIIYSSIVLDENGIGVANVEIYCPNCIMKKVKTNQDGSFHLEGYFDENSTFCQSSLIFSKEGKKSKTEIIDWREKSPQPINY